MIGREQPSLRGRGPVPGNSLRKLIAENFSCVSIHEAYTSKICHFCHNEVDKAKSDAGEKIWRGLLCEGCCSRKDVGNIRRVTNRDINAALNIREIFIDELEGKDRKSCFKKPNAVPTHSGHHQLPKQVGWKVSNPKN